MGTLYTLDEVQYERIHTHGAHAMIEHLCDDGIIDEPTANRLLATKQIIIRKKSALSSIWKRLFGGEDKTCLLVATIEDIRGSKP